MEYADTQYERDYAPGAGQFARALGWFSIGLGMAEMTAPRSVARAAGLHDISHGLVRALGAREIVHGVAILTRPSSAPRVWSRVAGDAVDLAVLGNEMNSGNTDSRRAAGAIAAVAGVTMLDILCASRLSGQDIGGEYEDARQAQRGSVRVEQVTTINRPIEEVFNFWRNFQNFPRFMRHIESVEILSERLSRWRAAGPAGMKVDWEAELLEDHEYEWLAWRTLEGADVQHSGSVRFNRAPGARGTELRVQLEYSPPAGRVGQGLAWLLSADPEQQIHEDLNRCKQILEAGEVTLSDGPGLRRAAQPASDPKEVRTLAGVHQ